MITYTVRSGGMVETVEASKPAKLNYILLRAVLQWDGTTGSLGALAAITSDEEGSEEMYLSTMRVLEDAGMLWDEEALGGS